MSAGCRCRCGTRQQNAGRACSQQYFRRPQSPRAPRPRRAATAARPRKPTAHQRATLSEQQCGRSASPSSGAQPGGTSPLAASSSGRRLPSSATWAGSNTLNGAWRSGGGSLPARAGRPRASSCPPPNRAVAAGRRRAVEEERGAGSQAHAGRGLLERGASIALKRGVEVAPERAHGQHLGVAVAQRAVAARDDGGARRRLRPRAERQTRAAVLVLEHDRRDDGLPTRAHVEAPPGVQCCLCYCVCQRAGAVAALFSVSYCGGAALLGTHGTHGSRIDASRLGARRGVVLKLAPRLHGML